MEYFLNIAIAVSVPVLLYFIIAYSNRRFKQMDRELEQRTEAASLTTTELKALVQEAVSESMSMLLDRMERNEQRLEEIEQILEHPRRSLLQVEAQRSLQNSALLEPNAERDEADPGEASPGQKRLRST